MNNHTSKKLSALLLIFSMFTTFIPISVQAATPIVATNISVEKTGSEPFDGSTWDGSNLTFAGTDANADNDVVRLQDSITYRVEVSANDSDVQELTSTVTLDKYQSWIELPTGCLHEGSVPANTTNPSTISADGLTMFCNLGPAIEGTTKVFFPASRAIGASYDGTVVTLNDQHVAANVTAQADGTSNVATDGPTDVTVTADFRINTTKDLKVPDADTDNDGNPDVIYKAPAKAGPNGEEGVLMEYIIKSTYQKGSMIADSDEIIFEMDYDLFDFYTDNNDNNNTSGSGSDLSTGGVLYTWGPDGVAGGCSLVGDHGANATITCTENTVVGDFTGPAFTPDTINDPNIAIDLDNIDVRDPDDDSNLIEVAINIWFPRTEDIETHQSCSGGGECENFVINTVGKLNGSTVEGFNPVSTEDVNNNNLLNYNGSGEPTFIDQTRSYAMLYSYPGISHFAFKSFDRLSAAKVGNEQYVGLGEIVPMYHWNKGSFSLDIGVDYTMRSCDKIDIQSYAYLGLAVADKHMVSSHVWWDSATSYGRNGDQVKLRLNTNIPGQDDVYIDGSTISQFLYSNEPNMSLLEMRDDECNDDVNNDGSIVIMNTSGGLVDENGNSTSGAIDWWEDHTMVPVATDGLSGITKVRQDTYIQPDYLGSLLSTANRWDIYSIHELMVRPGAIGYGTNNYLPNFLSWTHNYNNFPNFISWVHDSSDNLDPNDVSFSTAGSSSDRNILVPSNHSISKKTDPSGIKVIRGGDVVDFIVTPKVHGVWNNTISTATINDDLPNGTDYVSGSEMFSTDGGTTWLSRTDYDASSPDISITTPEHQGGADPLIWEFGSVDSGEQLPLIKYSVYADPEITSGTFTNTATISSDIGADQDGDGISDDGSATYQLTILPEYGFDVFKTVPKQVYSTNEAFDFNLIYKNLGGEAYTGGRFIDILPFDGDAAVGIGGINSDRDPATNFTGTYDLTTIVTRNSETVYVTDEDPTLLNLDPCASSNVASGYIPQDPELTGLFIDQLCYQDYINNGDLLPDGVSAGTNAANWQVCTGGATKTVSAHCPVSVSDVTAVRFDAANVPTSGGQTLTLTLEPTGNTGGEPVYTTSPSGLQEVDFDNSPDVGDKYTNSFGGRIPEISLNVISNDVTVTVVSGSIGNYVWYDLNGDGVQDSGEPALEGVVVNLLDSSGQPVYVDPVTGGIVGSTISGAIPYTATTDENGEYMFENIPAGNYTVSIDSNTLPSGAEATSDSDGIVTLNTSDLTLGFETDELGNTVGVEDNDTQDFGYFYTPLGSIGNYVWNDANSDEIQDASESSFSGVTLSLLDGAGDSIYVDPFTGFVVPVGTTGAIPYTTTTNTNGEYLFDNLPVGTYEVVLDPTTLPTDTFQSYDADGLATPHSSTHTFVEVQNDDGIVTDLVDNEDQDFGYFIGIPSWNLTKATTSTPMKQGDTLDYTFALENTGDLDINTITLVDDKCNVGPTLDATSDVGSDSILSPDEVWEYTCTSIAVTQQEADDGEVYNIATASGTPTGGTLEDAEGEITKPVGATPMIKLYKSITSIEDTSGDGLTGSGDTINYAFAVQNIGNVTLSGATVTDTSLTGLTLSGSTISTLAPNEIDSTSYTAMYVLTQADVDRGGVENTANVSATDPNGTVVTDISDTTTNPDASSVDNPDGTETENPFGDNSNDTNDATDDPTTYIVVPVPSVYVYKSVASIEDTIADDMVGAGDTINYSFTIKNTGNVTLTDIVLTDTSLENLVLSGSTIFTLAPNQIDSTTYTATYVLTQADVDRGGVENTANVSATDPNETVVTDISDTTTNPDASSVDNPDGTETESPFGDNSNDTDNATDDPTTYIVIPTPNWNIVKSTDSLPTEQGQTLDYVFTLENTGNVTISDISVTDEKCSALPTLDSTTDVNSDQKLSPGEIWKYSCTSIPVTLAEVDNGQVDNTVTASGTSPGNVEDTSHTISVPVGETPRLQLYKRIIDEDNRILTLDEDVITYSFTIENTGNVTITDVKLIDTKLGGDITSSCDFPISGTMTLEPEQVAECGYDYTYTQDDIDNGYVENSAEAEGLSPNDTIVSDISDAGDDTLETPDVFGATDDDAGNDPTHISIIVGFGSTGGGGGGGSSSSSSSSSGSPAVTEPEPVIEVEEEPVPEVEAPIETPVEEIEEETPQPVEQETETPPNVSNLDTFKKKYDTDIDERVRAYEEQINLFEELNVDIAGESLLKALPKVLPRTGTPISERVPTNPSSIVDTELPDASIFRLAGDTNENISHWTQVLVEEDRNANKYVVVPSNGLVMPINEFAEDSADFDTMINGREGNIMPSLRTGALEYPGTSTKGYGELGNKVVFAHSSYFAGEAGRYKTHFQKIIELDRGEEIWVYEKNDSGNYTLHKYVTEKSYETDDEDTSVLLPGEGKNLTLFTCTPIGGIAGRWIIKAKYIEDEISATPVSIPQVSQKYKLAIGKFVNRIEDIQDDMKRLETLYVVYDRLESLKNKYQGNTKMMDLLEYMQYKIAKSILSQ